MTVTTPYKELHRPTRSEAEVAMLKALEKCPQYLILQLRQAREDKLPAQTIELAERDLRAVMNALRLGRANERK